MRIYLQMFRAPSDRVDRAYSVRTRLVNSCKLNHRRSRTVYTRVRMHVRGERVRVVGFGLLHLIVLLPPACICTGVDGQTVVPWWCRQGRRKEGNDRLDFGQLDSSVLRDCMHRRGIGVGPARPAAHVHVSIRYLLTSTSPLPTLPCTRYSYKVFEVPNERHSTYVLLVAPLPWQ